ncbi:hypothetical protein [Pontibacterium sp.]|uniref:hypothetical protein n=1 Tax=Pontibacterium sp. TaxID=2036026 RepID=UPI00351967C9
MITVGALLAAGMASMMTLGQQSVVQGFQSTRAMQAAESGIQLELTKLIHPQVTGGCSDTDNAPFSYSFNAAGIRGCTASGTCEVTRIGDVDYTTITSVGRCGGNADTLDSASRRIRVRTIRPNL